MNDPARLTISSLAVEAGGKRLIDGFSMQLAAGELVAITGPSGCGKTTLLRTIAWLVDPAAGEVTLSGKAPCEIGWTSYRRAVTLVDQRPVLLDATVEQNLMRPFTYVGAGESYPAEFANKLMDDFRLGIDRLKQEARSLSVGQQQRLCLIRALLVKPKVLLLDEPTSALDPSSVGFVEDRIKAFAAEGGSALIVSHDRAQSARLCNRVIDLDPYLTEDALEAGKEEVSKCLTA